MCEIIKDEIKKSKPTRASHFKAYKISELIYNQQSFFFSKKAISIIIEILTLLVPRENKPTKTGSVNNPTNHSYKGYRRTYSLASRGGMCNPSFPGIHSIDQASLKLCL